MTEGGMKPFPYHYGSYATVPKIANGKLSFVFPYHYGSYATEELREEIQDLIEVSIPLWFLRNQFFGLERKELHVVSFHTTMVLTQLGKAYLVSHSFFEVSIPLWFLRNLHRICVEPCSRTVSIPLWFLRNGGHYMEREFIRA